MARGRRPGTETKQKEKGYIVINENIRLRIETDCITLEEVTGKNEETQENTYGNFKYFISWEGVLNYLVKRFTTEKVSQKAMLSFIEAKEEIIKSIKEVRSILLNEINNAMKSANEDIKKNIKKYNS